MDSQEKKHTSDKYMPSEIEPKWQEIWEAEKTYQPDLDSATSSNTASKGPFYNLMMFPYPSAEGLHVGNMYAQTGADIYGRFKRMQGYSVFEPVGLDGFGIHSENYALKVGSHPMEQADKAEKNFYRQMHEIGTSVDWSRTVETWKPDYYRWTQWVFTELFKAGLAYRSGAEVNWCPSCKTVLADEQVLQKERKETQGRDGTKDSDGTDETQGTEGAKVMIGVCERCDSEVEKRMMDQWFFRITGYSERLLQDLDKIDWTEKVKIAQRNWIGKSEGAKVRFALAMGKEQRAKGITELEVFTTRPDTLHGATFMVVSPEHPIVALLLNSKFEIRNSKFDEIRAYVEQVKKQSDKERRDESKEKTGVFSGLYAINPVNDQQIPIWIADYVLMGYGTGAIMAVPAHDPRDFEFAKRYNLPIVPVIQPQSSQKQSDSAYTGTGTLINSGEWNAWETPEAKQKAIAWLEEKGIGQKSTNYHLRDWLISRQRYWGAPIPMIYCEACAAKGDSWFTTDKAKIRNSKFAIRNSTSADVAGWYPEENLPVTLPHIDDYRPVGTGKAPLANHPEFYETTCPGCGGSARRETDVADTFLDSGWYFLRYVATDFSDLPFPMPAEILKQFPEASATEKIEAEKRTKWFPVTQYTGGAEHSVLHLLYARFIYKVFADLGYIDSTTGDEPFPRFFAHGLIIKDGAKMSKSKGNVIVPDVYIKKYGADSLRTYLMFLGPFSEGGDFQDAGIEGVHRFLKRIWKLFSVTPLTDKEADASSRSLMHRTIKGVTEDMEQMRYNTAIAKIMTWYNGLSQRENITIEEAETFLKLLAPLAPHMTEELYQRYSTDQRAKSEEKFESIHTSTWPEFDEAYLVAQTVTIAIQVNGKLRETLAMPRAESQEQKVVEEKAKESENVKRFIDGKEIKKAIFVPGKILNLVV